VQGSGVQWTVTIPANTTGFISDAEKGSLTSTRKYEGLMKSATGPNSEPGTRLQPGTYEFTAEVK